MVREFGQTSRHRAIKLVVVKVERVRLQSRPSSETLYKQCLENHDIQKAGNDDRK